VQLIGPKLTANIFSSLGRMVKNSDHGGGNGRGYGNDTENDDKHDGIVANKNNDNDNNNNNIITNDNNDVNDKNNDSNDDESVINEMVAIAIKQTDSALPFTVETVRTLSRKWILRMRSLELIETVIGIIELTKHENKKFNLITNLSESDDNNNEEIENKNGEIGSEFVFPDIYQDFVNIRKRGNKEKSLDQNKNTNTNIDTNIYSNSNSNIDTNIYSNSNSNSNINTNVHMNLNNDMRSYSEDIDSSSTTSTTTTTSTAASTYAVSTQSLSILTQSMSTATSHQMLKIIQNFKNFGATSEMFSGAKKHENFAILVETNLVRAMTENLENFENYLKNENIYYDEKMAFNEISKLATTETKKKIPFSNLSNDERAKLKTKINQFLLISTDLINDISQLFGEWSCLQEMSRKKLNLLFENSATLFAIQLFEFGRNTLPDPSMKKNTKKSTDGCFFTDLLLPFLNVDNKDSKILKYSVDRGPEILYLDKTVGRENKKDNVSPNTVTVTTNNIYNNENNGYNGYNDNIDNDVNNNLIIVNNKNNNNNHGIKVRFLLSMGQLRYPLYRDTDPGSEEWNQQNGDAGEGGGDIHITRSACRSVYNVWCAVGGSLCCVQCFNVV
jgi:hypothetical protein